MPAYNEVLTYGTVASNSSLDLLDDEADFLVTSCTRSGSREKEEFRNSKRSVEGLEYYNARFTVTINGNVLGFGAAGSFTARHPGTQITALSNFDTTYFDFDIADGSSFFEQPTIEAETDNAPTGSFNLEHYPYVIITP